MILLDSHAFYWLVTGQREFGKAARHGISRANNVYVSSLSILELTVKRMKQKLSPLDFQEAIEISNLLMLDFRVEDAVGITDFATLSEHDPIDRALLSQARANSLDFYTADQKLLGLGLSWVKDLRD